MVGINDLVLAMKRMQKVPDDEKDKRIEEVLKALDIDKDGAIDVEHALKVKNFHAINEILNSRFLIKFGFNSVVKHKRKGNLTPGLKPVLTQVGLKFFIFKK